LSTTEISQVEKDIVHLLSTKDSKCLDLVYKHYSAALYGVILNIVKTDEIAEEVLQDVFLKFWQNADAYDSNKSRLFTWLINIARNTAIDKVRSAAYKKSKRTDDISGYLNFNEQLKDETSTVDSGLLNVINGLDEKYRKLIYLVYYQGYSQREITKEFDIPLGTVKTRLRSAIGALRAQLNDEMLRKLIYSLPLVNLISELLIQNGH